MFAITMTKIFYFNRIPHKLPPKYLKPLNDHGLKKMFPKAKANILIHTHFMYQAGIT